MINNDRIVPITRTNLLTNFSVMLSIAGTSYSKIDADDTDGNFSITGSGSVGNKLASQPLKSGDFKTGVTAGVVYFVAGYDYEGFKVAGTKVTTAGADVVADASTLYTATLSSGTVTIAKVGQ